MRDFEELPVVAVPKTRATPTQPQDDQQTLNYPRDYGIKRVNTKRTENKDFGLPPWFDG